MLFLQHVFKENCDVRCIWMDWVESSRVQFKNTQLAFTYRDRGKPPWRTEESETENWSRPPPYAGPKLYHIKPLTQSLRSDVFDTLQHSCVLSTPQHLPVAYPIKGSTFLLKSNINTWLLTCALLVFLKDEGEGCTKSFLPILSILAFSTCIHLKCYASWFCWSLQCKSPVVRQDSSIRRSVESFYIIYQTRWHQQLLSDVQHNHVIHLLTLGTICDERYEGLEMSYQCSWSNNFFGSFLIYQLACSGFGLIFNLWIKKKLAGLRS